MVTVVRNAAGEEGWEGKMKKGKRRKSNDKMGGRGRIGKKRRDRKRKRHWEEEEKEDEGQGGQEDSHQQQHRRRGRRGD